jgi:hypothetical protein
MKLRVAKLVALVLSNLFNFVILQFVELLCASIFTSLLAPLCVCPGSEMGGLSSGRNGFIVYLYPDR